jgi:hypothetical protein
MAVEQDFSQRDAGLMARYGGHPFGILSAHRAYNFIDSFEIMANFPAID